MMKIKENEFKQYLKYFNNNSVKLKIKGIINIKMNIKKFNIVFDYENGLLYFSDIQHNNNFNISTSSLYNIEIREDYKMLILDFDEDIHIQIYNI